MTEIKCGLSSCIHCDENYICTKEKINLIMDFGIDCDDFEDITDTEEYKQPYWKRCASSFYLDDISKQFRTLNYGKKMEVSGLVLYTEFDTRRLLNGELIVATEEDTGMLVKFKHKDMEKVTKMIKDYKEKNKFNLMDLPVKETYEFGGIKS